VLAVPPNIHVMTERRRTLLFSAGELAPAARPFFCNRHSRRGAGRIPSDRSFTGQEPGGFSLNRDVPVITGLAFVVICSATSSFAADPRRIHSSLAFSFSRTLPTESQKTLTVPAHPIALIVVTRRGVPSPLLSNLNKSTSKFGYPKHRHPYQGDNVMKVFSANIEDLRSLYISNLKKALDMEQKITKALPDLIEKSTDADLALAFQTHLEETKRHVTKVEGLLQRNTGERKTEACKVINALTTEASDTIKDVTDTSIRDIALIGAAQQVEHHEIAVYGTLRRWAEILGLPEDVLVLESIEEEEGNADQLLSQIADRVNFKAAA
jgi:ferritin-like metal-binding protein YciE